MLGFICFLFIHSIDASQWIPKKDSTYELEMVVTSMNKHFLKRDEWLHFEKTIEEIDFLLSQFRDNEMHFLLKTTVYKFLIANAPKVNKPRVLNFKKLLQRDSEKIKTFNPFLTWLYKSIQSDFRELTSDPRFLSTKSTKDIKDAVQRKKFNLLLPWLLYFHSDVPELLNINSQGLLVKLLDEVRSTLSSYLTSTYKTPKKMDQKYQMVWFERKDDLHKRLAKKEKVKKKGKVASIVDDVVSKKKKVKTLPQPVDDWTPKDDDFTTERGNLILPKPDPGYQSPKELPKPVDDWILEY
jgi:hypothetical protein